MYKCGMCNRKFPEYDRTKVILHYFSEHQGNLQFLSDEEIKEGLIEKE